MRRQAKPIYARLGERLAMARQLRGLRQSDVAERIGLTRTSVVNIEAGRQAVLTDTLIQFCKLFRTRPDILLGFERPSRRKRT